MNKRYFRIILIVMLLVSLTVFSVHAEQEEKAKLSITTVEEFLTFAESCRLDSFSQDLTVSLDADLDLTDADFHGIPIFCGTFSGNGHTISGLDLQPTGSNVGLFRYLTDTATVTDLNLSGTVAPAGSGANTGSIAGTSSGVIQGCSFDGTVQGTDHVGGIAGFVTSSGSVEACTVSGTVTGNHFVGGIAGTNQGILQNCENSANVNTDPAQDEVDLSDITLQNLTGSESATTVTDIGGIAGASSGYIRYCENNGNIGYQSIGYNIGGIAGSLTGYLADCQNNGAISGRKEIGGIAGQLEPAIAVTYSADTLQILSSQLETLSNIASNLNYHVDTATNSIREQIVLIQGNITDTKDVLTALLPTEDTENTVPNVDAMTQSAEKLKDNMSAINENLNNILRLTENAGTTLTQDLRSMSNIIQSMQQTIGSASDNLGGTVFDSSDSDTDEDLTAKIDRCINKGDVYADLNGGGIAGAVCLENDLDPEDDIMLFGNSSLNFSGEYRAVISNCENFSAVTVKKQYAGGITGLATLGLIRSCTNTGILDTPDAQYTGGIAGYSDGYIRSCSVKSQISGTKYVGGIAGSAEVVSDCRAMVHIQASEQYGCILGTADDLSLLSGNYYMLMDQDTGAVDGISYAEAAQPLSLEEFLAIENTEDFFKSFTVTFVLDDGTEHTVTLNTGERLTADLIPELTQNEDCVLSWPDMEKALYFDTVIHTVSTPMLQVIQSTMLRDNGLPVLLAEGSYTDTAMLTLNAWDEDPMENTVEAWYFSAETTPTVLRYLPPATVSTEELTVMLYSADGQWREAEHTVTGSYLAFSPQSTDTGFCIIITEKVPVPWLPILCGASVIIIAAVITTLVLLRKKHKRTTPTETVQAEG